jgi:hypothetical protein
MKRIFKSILWILLIVLVGAQFFQIDKTNPPHDPATDFLSTYNPPAEVSEMFKNACYDCHSNLTQYPWYTHIQPVGIWIKNHINGARHSMNFSIWTTYNGEDKAELLKEIAGEVQKGKMPLPSYTWGHKSAKLTQAQRETLVNWVKSQAGNEQSENPARGNEGGEVKGEGENESEHD